MKFPSDRFFHGDEIILDPENSVNSKHNTWRGIYLTDAKTPDGPYAVTATVNKDISSSPDSNGTVYAGYPG